MLALRRISMFGGERNSSAYGKILSIEDYSQFLQRCGGDIKKFDKDLYNIKSRLQEIKKTDETNKSPKQILNSQILATSDVKLDSKFGPRETYIRLIGLESVIRGQPALELVFNQNFLRGEDRVKIHSDRLELDLFNFNLNPQGTEINNQDRYKQLLKQRDKSLKPTNIHFFDWLLIGNPDEDKGYFTSQLN